MGRRKKEKLIPSVCEICDEPNPAVLHKHHIVERTDPDTSNHENNLAIICSNCHNKIHAKPPQIKIIGVFPSTKLPYKRTLVYEINGVSNAPGLVDPPFKSKAASMRIYYESTKE
jgi:hypothetical protein